MRTTTLFTPVLLCVPAWAQSAYDFNNLSGSDTAPYTSLQGQDNWSVESFNTSIDCGVTATLGFDASECLRFEQVGPGVGCDASRINDASWSFASFDGSETQAYFQFDLSIGFWGGSVSLGTDVNGNSILRGSEAGERGPIITLGTNSNVGIRLTTPGGVTSTESLASAGGAGGGDWLRLRLVMDLATPGGLGTLQYINLSTGGTTFQNLPALTGVPLGLDNQATDASNPTLWDAVWLHFEGATYQLDNLQVGLANIGMSYCSTVNNSTGGAAQISAAGNPSQAAGPYSVTLRAVGLPANQFGYFLAGRIQGFVPLPGGSQGSLCLALPLARLIPSLQSSGASGQFEYAVDVNFIPLSPGVAIQAGETWNFQAWYRDVNPNQTSNFTDGVAIDFN